MVTHTKKNKMAIRNTDKQRATKFKKIMEKSAKMGKKSKIEVLKKIGYQQNNAKQIFSNVDRNLPAFQVAEYCKQVGNNLLAESIAKELGMKLVPIKSQNKNDLSEAKLLKKQLEFYKEIIAQAAIEDKSTLYKILDLSFKQSSSY